MTLPRAVMILLCTMLQLCFGTVYAWSFFQTLLVRQLGWAFTETAIAFSITIFSLGMSAAWAGAALPRHGPRKLAIMGSSMFSCGYLLAGLALYIDSLPLFYIGYGVIGGAGIGLGYVTPVATAAKWYPDHKGLATGIVVMGFGFGAFLLSKLLAPFLIITTEGDLAQVFVWLGVLFAAILLPSSYFLRDPPSLYQVTANSASASREDDDSGVSQYLRTREFTIMWLVFFFNIAAGISVISFQSSLLQDVWGLADPSIEPELLAQYGATLIAVSSLCNGVGRLFWGLLSDRFGRVRVFRFLLASQMVVFGILMTESNPWIFSALVCYVLLCSAAASRLCLHSCSMFSVSGKCRPSTGAILTAWAAAGIFGPIYVGYLKDQYPDRATIYCFLIGVLILGVGFTFSYLLNDERVRLARPTIEGTLHQFGIPAPRRKSAPDFQEQPR